MVFLFNWIIKDILSNYIPHETIICENRDPLWINNRVEELMRKMIFFKVTFIVIRIPRYSIELIISRVFPESFIEANKKRFYSCICRRMMNPLSIKTKWSILTWSLYNKNICCIPSLLHQNRFITKYKDKAELFSNFFANQCTLITNSSVLPCLIQTKRKCNLFHQFPFGWHCENIRFK